MDEQNINQTGTEPMPIKLDVSVRPVQSDKNLLAFASVTFNDQFKMHGFKIVNSEKGSFVDMPSSPDGKGGFRDACFPITADFRAQLTTAILDGYDKQIEKMQGLVQTAENTRRAPPKQKIEDQIKAGVDKAKRHITPPPAAGNRAVEARA